MLTAAEHHADRLEAIDRRMDALRRKVVRTSKMFRATGSTDWGYVGDLGRIIDGLDALLGKEA